jgi:hypothetical protein
MLNINKTIILLLVCASGISQVVHSEDIFRDNSSQNYRSITPLSIDATVGGYPIFQGGITWYVISASSTENNVRIKLGNLHLVSTIDEDYFAEMIINTNLSQGNSYFAAETCRESHLFKNNKGGGKFDNCMTIDPQSIVLAEGNKTILLIGVRNSKEKARLYDIRLGISLDKLGFPGTNIYDWTEDAIRQDQLKSNFFDQIIAWANKLQNGVEKAIDYNKPSDAFVSVPSFNDVIKFKEKSIDENSSPFGKNSKFLNNDNDPKYLPFGTETESRATRPIVAPPVSKEHVTVEKRLEELKVLLDKKLITKEQYEADKIKILDMFN